MSMAGTGDCDPPARELCVRRVEAVVEHYRDIGIDVVNSTGDQFSLLSESLPGDRIRLNSYVQRQPLYTIAGGMPTATVDLGDCPDGGAGWVGPYIGQDAGPGPVDCAFRSFAGCGQEPADGDCDYR